ncbi:helix-turn-helix transcriptional regulator [Gorillibacterium sp. CAU 1737]|uniref:PadR family transcriptional regulator n=1 Tax=Gorillibacterium sp. CAU 1737 TaxID=3140362 RepID=UPI003261B8A7
MLNSIILGMLYHEKLTGYDLKKRIENGVGVFYKASYGSIYPTLKKLSNEGLVSVTEEQHGARQKKLYDITPQGRVAFMNWLKEPIHLDDGNSKQSHLARVYFFDALPAPLVHQQLLEYEANNLQYLDRLLALEPIFDTPENQDKHYYKLSTLYYGIAILRETLRWCRHARERRPFHELVHGGENDEPNRSNDSTP